MNLRTLPKFLLNVVCLLSLWAVSASAAYNFTTLAGVAPGSRNATGVNARFWSPRGVAVDGAGTVYVADTNNHTIRMITAAGVVTTLAGSPGESGNVDDVGGAARFNGPSAVALDGAGNNLFVADSFNGSIRQIEISSGTVTTLVSGFMTPSSVVVDGGTVYVADLDAGTVSSVDIATQNVTLLADSSNGLAVPSGIAVDATYIYVADSGQNAIYTIAKAGGAVLLLAGSGTGEFGTTDDVGNLARFDNPFGIVADGSGAVYVADSFNNTIRKVESNGTVSTVAGTALIAGALDANGLAATFNGPAGVALTTTGDIIVADTNNNTIRVVGHDVTRAVTTLAGAYSIGSADGTSTARFHGPIGVAVDSVGNVYIADTDNHTIRKINPAGLVTTLAGTAGVSGYVNDTGTAAQFFNPQGLAVDASDNLYVADTGNHAIRKIIAATGEVTTYAGTGSLGSANGLRTAATFNLPSGVAVDAAGNVYVADTANDIIRKINQSDGQVITLAGSGAQGSHDDPNGALATFKDPKSLTVDSSGNLYVADPDNHTIRKIAPDGGVTTLAGTAGSLGSTDDTGTAAQFNQPGSVAVDSSGNVFVADTYNYAIRKITPAGVVTTIAGKAGFIGNADGVSDAARFNAPKGIAVSSAGDLYVADWANNAIRKGSREAAAVTLSNLNATYDGTAKAATATTNPVGLTVVIAYKDSGNNPVASPTAAGSYTVTATVNDPLYAGTATDTLVIAKATATVTLGNLNTTYNGSPRSATATTSPAGKTVILTYDGGSTPPTNAGTYAVEGTVDDPNYDGQADDFLVIAKSAQTISFTGPADQIFGVSPITLSASASSSLPVSFSVVSGPATVSGNQLTITGAGSVTVRASCGANANYLAAVDVDQTFNVGKATAIVTLGSLAATYNGSPITASATTNPAGLTVAFTYDGSATAPTNTGTYAVVGTISDNNYQGSASGSLVVSKATATVTLGSLAVTYDGSAKAATATTTPSGKTVTFTYDGSATVPTNAGTYAVVGTISDNNYQGSASGSLAISKATATVTLGSLAVTYDGSAKAATATTTPSGKTVTFTYDGSATVPTNAGSYAVVGTISDANYQGSASGSLVISKATATVTLGSLAATYDGSAKAATATTTPSGKTVTFTYDGSATVPTNAGTYAVVGTISDTNYQGSASGSLVISKATATVTLGSLAATYDGSAKAATATTTPSGKTVTFTYDGSATVPTNAGTYAVVGTISDTNYQGSASGSLVISKATATVTLGSLAATYDGSAKAATATTTPSGKTVTFTYDGSATVPTNAGSYAVVGTINDINYQGSASGTLVISKATATVTLGSLAATYDGSAKAATATTTPSGKTVTFTYDGSATVPTNAGTYAVVGTISDNNYQGTASGSLVISKATATVTLGSLAATYDGSAKAATATTTPSGKTVTFTYDGSATTPTNAGTYAVVGTISDTNYQGSASGSLVISKATATVTLGSLILEYNGSARVATATTNPVGKTVNFTYDGSATAPTNAGQYAVVGTINDTNYAGSATGTMIVSPQLVLSLHIGSTNVTYDGTPKPLDAFTVVPANIPLTVTYNGSTTAPTNAGTYSFGVVSADPNYSASAAGLYVIAKATATVTLGNLAATYDGSAKSASATTTPTSLVVSFTYGGSAPPPTNAGSYAVVGTINDANYQGSASGTLVISKAPPTITWAAPAAITYGTALSATQLSASSSVAGTFVYSPVAGTVLSVGTQTLSVTFTPADATNYTTATAERSLTVALGTAPVFTQQPSNQTVAVGTSATFTAAASGSPAPTYQWKKNDVNIAGATNATYTIASVQASDAASYTVVATNSGGSTTSNAAVLTIVPFHPSDGMADFNNDGHPDLLWQNSVTGQRSIWLMNGLTATGGVDLGTVPVEWVIAGTADFTGDGKTDLLWQNTVTGQRSVWAMNGTTAMYGVDLGTVSLDWWIAGVGDFNGDGKPDILWTNTVTNERAIWLMNGTTKLSNVSLGVIPFEWTIAGAADFNLDGKTDILWSNVLTGERSIWLMNGTTSISGISLGFFTPRLQISGTGDYNGDGSIDILLSDQVSGERSVWLMSGTSIASTVSLGTVSPDWILNRPVPRRVPVDFNADNKSDIVWQNTVTGERAAWLMNGTTALSGISLGTRSIDWEIVATGDFNFDGRADLVWQNNVTGECNIWLMNGGTKLSEVALPTLPLDWKFRATGDFNLDGAVDLVLQNTATGECAVWFMNGTTPTGGASLGIQPLTMQIVGCGDFNADSKADLVWTNTATGERSIWLMNGTTMDSSVSLGVVPLQWAIAGTGDFDQDGNADLVWQNTATGERSIWLMSGTTPRSGVSLGTAPTSWSIRN